MARNPPLKCKGGTWKPSNLLYILYKVYILKRTLYQFLKINFLKFLALLLLGCKVSTEAEAVIQWCSYEKVLRKYAANLQQNAHAEV